MYIPHENIWKRVNELYKLKFNQLVENSETKLIISSENSDNEIVHKAHEKPLEHCGLTVQSQEYSSSHMIWYMIFGKLGRHTVELNTNPSEWVTLSDYTHFSIPLKEYPYEDLLTELKKEREEADAKIRVIEESLKHLAGLNGKSELEKRILQLLIDETPTVHTYVGCGYLERRNHQQIKSIEELENFFNQLSPQFLWSLIPK